MARSQLDSLFGATCNSIIPLVCQIAQGKPISEYDLDRHLSLFTKMISTESTSEISQLDQLDRREMIANIAENRAKKMWELDEELKEREREGRLSLLT